MPIPFNLTVVLNTKNVILCDCKRFSIHFMTVLRMPPREYILVPAGKGVLPCLDQEEEWGAPCPGWGVGGVATPCPGQGWCLFWGTSLHSRLGTGL